MNSAGVPYDDPTGDFGEADEDGFAVGGAQITKPGPHDVLLGRGGGTNNHFGNVKFRKLVNEHKMRYLACSKVDKPKVAREVVEIWRKMNPPGRFLARKDESKKGPGSVKDSNNVWLEVGDKKAREKASQCLRERTPDVLPYIKQLRQQQDQMTEHGVAVVQQQLQMQQQVNGGIDGDMKLNSPGMMNHSRPSVSALARRGSLPVVPSSVASSAIPTIHSSASRRTSLPTVSSLQGSSNMQMNSMMRQQQQLRHRAMNDPFLQERQAALLQQQEFNMSPRLLAERSLMMQQQYGIADMPSMASANMYNQQVRMMSPQSNNPRPVLSMQQNGGHLMTPQPHMMSPQPNAVRSYPLSTGALNNRLNPQLGMMQQLPQQPPLVQDLEPLPYDDGQGNNQLLPVPDMATSIPNPQAQATLPQGAAKRQNQKDPATQQKVAGSLMHQGAKESKRATPTGRLKQDDMQPFPLDAKQEQQKQKSKTSKGTNESRGDNPKAPIPGHVDDGELTLREYRKTLEDYITNHQIAAPPADVLEDDPENEFALEGLDTSAWIQQALNTDDSGSDLMESAGSVGEPKGRRGMLSTQKSQKSLMSTGTSYMSMAISEMEQSVQSVQSGNDDTVASGAGLSRESKMNMSRSMKSDHSLMSELTDFSNSEIL